MLVLNILIIIHYAYQWMDIILFFLLLLVIITIYQMGMFIHVLANYISNVQSAFIDILSIIEISL